MAYEKFIPTRGGHGERFSEPYVTINKGGMSFNRHVKEMIGDGLKYVVLFFDKEAWKIGFWFWKDSCPGSYAIIRHKSHESFSVNGKAFFKAYEIHEKIKKCDTRHFPLEPDKESKQSTDFYCIQLKSVKGKTIIEKE